LKFNINGKRPAPDYYPRVYSNILSTFILIKALLNIQSAKLSRAAIPIVDDIQYRSNLRVKGKVESYRSLLLLLTVWEICHLMFAARAIFVKVAISSAISLSNCSDEPGVGSTPSGAQRCRRSGSLKMRVIS